MKNYYQETFFCSDEKEKEQETETESTQISQDADEVVKDPKDIPEEN